MVKRLIFVHGINNQDYSVDEIQEKWSNALRGSLGAVANTWWGDDLEIRTAYYADVLHAAEQEWKATSEAVTAMAANSPEGDFAPDEVAALYLEFQRVSGLSDDQVRQYLDPEDDRHVRAVRMGSGIHKKWLKAIARALEEILPGAAPGVARAFLPQAAAYLHKPGLFDEINSRVENQVFNGIADDAQTVVVAHSLGTIVSYVTLRKMMGNRSVPLFLTLGSPLGIDIVKRRIQGPYVRPPVVRKWTNGSDPEDFVALHPELNRETFGPAEVDNHATLDNGHNNPHDITRYLGQPAVALAVAQAFS